MHVIDLAKNNDPYKVARRFVSTNGLDESLIDSLTENILCFLKNFEKRADKKESSANKIFNKEEELL